MKFGPLEFEIKDDKIQLIAHGGFATVPYGFVEVQVGGENKGKLGIKVAGSSESKKFTYVSHEVFEDTLIVTQRTDKVQVKTFFQSFKDTNALRVHTEVENISKQEIILEEVSAFVLYGVFGKTIDAARELHFTRFIQSHHTECQPRRYTFFDLGMHRGNSQSQRRIAFANIGSQSTKEELPQAIL